MPPCTFLRSAGFLQTLPVHHLLQVISQQLAQDPANPNTPFAWVLAGGVTIVQQTLHAVFNMWGNSLGGAEAALVPTMVRTMLPILQQVQRCSELLPPGPAAGAGALHSTPAGVYHGAEHSVAMTCLTSVHKLQRECGLLLADLTGVMKRSPQQPAVRDAITHRGYVLLLQCPATSELLLQLLAGHTVLSHSRFAAQQQQQQQLVSSGRSSRSSSSGDASGASPLDRLHQRSQHMSPPSETTAEQSSSGSSNGGSSSSRQAHQAPASQARIDRLPAAVLAATGLQNGLAQLLPGGSQQYADAAAAVAKEVAAAFKRSEQQQAEHGLLEVSDLLSVLLCSLETSLDAASAKQQSSADAPVLSSAAAVHMMVELQLVTAGLLQCQWQQGQQVALQTARVMRSCFDVLELQIEAFLQVTGSNSLPVELLQHAGLQLLQALAAPVQQLQLLLAQQQRQQQQRGMTGINASLVDDLCNTLQCSSGMRSSLGQALYMLGAAAAGLAAPDATSDKHPGMQAMRK
jgi:hypothetical protein